MTSYWTGNFHRTNDGNGTPNEKQDTYLMSLSESEHHGEPRMFDWFSSFSKHDGLSSKR
jgi:hypothetical protein